MSDEIATPLPTTPGGGPPGGEILASDMTLRDYFAGQCLIGLLSGSRFALRDPVELAHTSYRMADAMMKEREKTN